MTYRNRVPSRSIINPANFVFATRDAGYRGPAWALAELIDNSIDAGASQVEILLSPEGDLEVGVRDNGKGMSRDELSECLIFGGSSRFNQRASLGRFGMGLPASSVSQARRVDVYSWQLDGTARCVTLDVDSAENGIGTPRTKRIPRWLRSETPSNSGTIVVWSRCDRIRDLRGAQLADSLRRAFGRIFRYYIWDGLVIRVDGQPTEAIDPLFLRTRETQKATEYGGQLLYETTAGAITSSIAVRFAELPIESWANVPNDQKRRMGITKGAGVSILRGTREIAFGWHLMGDKRKENYDDWWRAEVTFEPALDELFGVTHTKQGIRPTSELRRMIEGDLSSIARGLNARVRRRFGELRQVPGYSEASQKAASLEPGLQPIRRKMLTNSRKQGGRHRYKLEVRPLESEAFYSVELRNGSLSVVLNQNHTFYTELFSRAKEVDPRGVGISLEMLMLALARAEIETRSVRSREWQAIQRSAWGRTTELFLSRQSRR